MEDENGRFNDSCLCEEGAETFLHMQLAFKLESRTAAIPGAHDDVMSVRVLEEVMSSSHWAVYKKIPM